jgi:hypothetical protein
MAANGIIDEQFNRYLDSWAQLMITIWKEKIAAYNIGITGELERSLKTEVTKQAGGDSAKVEHFFNYYGLYVAAGVGREVSKGNPGDLGFTPKRQPKPWVYSKYKASKMNLLGFMLKHTGSVYMASISKILKTSDANK